MTRIVHTRPPEWPDDIPPARLAAHVHAGLPVACRIALLGLPDDLGVRLNHGRPGAKGGPAAFRDALARYGVAEPAGITYPRVFDAGDVIPAEGHTSTDLAETHRRVSQSVEAILALGMLPVGIGGGHDLTYPFVRGVINHRRGAGQNPISGVVYFDAHLDVRDAVGSGMPFRRLIEDCGVASLVAHGISPFANTREHVDYFRAQGGRPAHHPADRPSGDYAASFDLDVLDASHAPGVSAMNPSGWSVARAAREVEQLGADPRCRCFDLMELCPPHDEQGRTARVAAHLFLCFLRGFSRRPTEARA